MYMQIYGKRTRENGSHFGRKLNISIKIETAILSSKYYSKARVRLANRQKS